MGWASPNCVKEIRTRYLSLGNEHNQKEWVIQLLPAEEGALYFIPSYHAEALVCEQAFLHLTGISPTKLQSAKELRRSGLQFVKQTSGRPDPKFVSVAAFLETYVREECTTTLHGTHLPDDMRFKNLYMLYCRKLETDASSRASDPYFHQVRRETQPHLHESNTNDFNACPTCVRLQAAKRKKAQGSSPDDLERVMLELAAHTKLRRAQDVVTKQLDFQSASHPDQLAMVFVDQTPVPAFPHEASAVYKGLHRFRLLAGGTLARSGGTGAIFLSLHDSKGPNLIQTQLWIQVREIFTSPTRVSLASWLHIQADLTTGENRNWCMVGMLGLYVFYEWVKRATFGAQLEYHGRSVVDSTVHRSVKGALSKKPLHTPIDYVAATQEGQKKLVSSLASCDPTTPKRKALSVIWLKNQIDWKGFMDQHVNRFSKITEARTFQVEKGGLLVTFTQTLTAYRSS